MNKPSIFDLVVSFNLKKTSWHRCSVCGDQFTSKRLLKIHKTKCAEVSQ